MSQGRPWHIPCEMPCPEPAALAACAEAEPYKAVQESRLREHSPRGVRCSSKACDFALDWLQRLQYLLQCGLRVRPESSQ